MTWSAALPVAGVAFAALASLAGVLATQRAAKTATTRQTSIDEFRAQVAARDAWIAEMDRRVVRLENALLVERNYVDRLRDWIAAVALPVLVQRGVAYPAVPEWSDGDQPNV